MIASQGWIRGCYGLGRAEIVEPGASQRPPSSDRPVDPAGTVQNANDAFRTVPWTAHTPRRPQAPRGPAADLHHMRLEQIGATA
jgi:hypothetical protein